MNLAAHYDAMRAAALPRLAQGRPELDALLEAPHDPRRGLTLLARPPAAIAEAIGNILADFRQHEPDQYYYPATDLHLTILSLISCHDGFTLAAIDPAAYRAVVGAVLARSRPFTVRLAGLTASAGGILVQGFPQDEGLAAMRTGLRQAFGAAGLRQSIDQRYRIQTAHSTIIRFRAPLRQPAHLLHLLAKYRHYPLGTWEIRTAELVFNDWYQRAANTVLLKKYPLPAGPTS